MRDGIQLRAMLEVAKRGIDDEGNTLAIDAARLADAVADFDQLWADNPVQWYLRYDNYRSGVRSLFDAMHTESIHADR